MLKEYTPVPPTPTPFIIRLMFLSWGRFCFLRHGIVQTSVIQQNGVGWGGKGLPLAQNGQITITLLNVSGSMIHAHAQQQSMILPKMSIALKADRLSTTHGRIQVSKVIIFFFLQDLDTSTQPFLQIFMLRPFVRIHLLRGKSCLVERVTQWKT